MPQDPSQMAGMAPAFMNQPQYQQQMQQLAMQVRQQEDGIKKTKKFLKAYEDIQLSQPMPQQQPAFMQPPGGMAQAMNNNLPQVEEAPMSFTQMAGGMGAQGEAGPEGQSGPGPQYDRTYTKDELAAKFPGTKSNADFAAEGGAGQNASNAEKWNAMAVAKQKNMDAMDARNPRGANTPPGTDPGLAEMGETTASEPQVQRERVANDSAMRKFGKDKAKASAGGDLYNKGKAADNIDVMLSDLEKSLKDAKEQGGPDSSRFVDIKKRIGEIKKLQKTAEEAFKKAQQKYSAVARSLPNKAISAGLGTVMGGNLMADAHRYARGGVDEKGNTYYPGEIQNVEGVNRIRSAVEELAYYHPDNADLHPEVTDADRKKYNPNWFK